MYYVAIPSLVTAIERLHSSGSNEYFRTYLVLKAHGLRYQGGEVRVTTGNTQPALNRLLGVRGLPQDRPFYNPLMNEFLRAHASRSVVQTFVNNVLNNEIPVISWLEGKQVREGNEKPCIVKFSADYPNTLGRGKAGMARSDTDQITIHTPSFVLWMHRFGEWTEQPTFEQLWQVVQQDLNLSLIEIDLLFSKEREFVDNPFTTTAPDSDALAQAILGLPEGAGALRAPSRTAFSIEKMRRIVASTRNLEADQGWWQDGEKTIEQEASEVLDDARALLLIGPPGTGKTRLARQLAKRIVSDDETRIHFFEFHAAYAYEDFIEALVPDKASDTLRFVPEKKRFADICSNARGGTDHVVILDELNRADISRVFGEAFVLLERAYRQEEYAVSLLYSGELFWIPENVYIIATLNDLDKTTYDLDFAFRRRFGQVAVPPRSDALKDVLSENVDDDFIRILQSAFNEVQTIYPLGHVYFRGIRDRTSLRNAYRRVIRPTIAAYLGQYRQSDLDKVDTIMKQAYEATSWDQYIGVNE